MMKTFDKAGLSYSDEKGIIIANKEKWERIKLSMSSTTNALESTHGHLNAEIPRRNNFWSAMMRLVKYVLTKENNFANAFKTNYMREKRVIDKKCRENAMIMDKQKEFYHTNLVSCECGETKLISRMMRIEIPCSHIYSMKKKSRKYLRILSLSFQKMIMDFI